MKTIKEKIISFRKIIRLRERETVFSNSAFLAIYVPFVLQLMGWKVTTMRTQYISAQSITPNFDVGQKNILVHSSNNILTILTELREN